MSENKVVKVNLIQLFIVLIVLLIVDVSDGRILPTDDEPNVRNVLSKTEQSVHNEPIKRCRVTCLEKFLYSEQLNEELQSNNIYQAFNHRSAVTQCKRIPDCYMCYDFCEILHQEPKTISKLMCSNVTCLSGCKYSCMFYSLISWNNQSIDDGNDKADEQLEAKN